jgi:hypothetical protein
VRRAVLVLLAALAVPGCVGEITGLGGGAAGDDDDSVTNPDTPRNLCASGDKDIAGPRLLRRLTSAEVQASVRDVFALSAADWAGGALPTDPAGRNGFTNNADRLTVDPGFAGSLLGTSKEIATLVKAPQKLAQLLPCAAGGGGDEACARAYLATIGRRLYRRPLTDAEVGRYLDLYAKIRASGSFADWVYWATVGLLDSPSFVYRSELGDPDGGAGYRLSGYEIATALAYDLTGKPPSPALLDQAAAGGLDSPEQVADAARALALDPATGKARPELRALFLKFTDQWLGLSPLANLQKSATDFPDFTDAVRASMKQETDAFVSHIVFEDGGGVKELLTSKVSYVDDTLAAYYGWAGAAGADAPTPRPEGWGEGLLAQGSILAINAGNTKTSPTQRGKLVRKKLLCYDLPPPPPVVGDLPQPTGNETTRQRYEDIHAGNPSCAGCHAMMDGIGFGFEHLDASGRYRATEDGLTIDDSGYFRGLASEDIAFRGPAELAEQLAGRPEPYTCAAEYLASFVYGLDHHDTSCLVTSLAEDFAAGKLGLVDFYVQLTSTRYFTRRVDGE